MAKQTGPGILAGLSAELADTVELAARFAVRIDDGTRLTATGILWSPDGVVVATSHGVERDEDLAIELADGSRHAATLVGRDPDTDIAVLRIEGAGLSAADRAGPAEARVGNIVLAIGRPGSSGLRATVGIVTARIETETGGEPGYLLHTDAVLYPGFSGGPLIGAQGHVVGMCNVGFGRRRGLAIGTPVVEQVANALLANGQIRRGYLGVRAQSVELPEGIRTGLSLGQQNGLLVIQVEPASAAEQAGMLLGDTLLQIDGHSMADVDDLRRHLRALRSGQKTALRLLRAGELRDVEATLHDEP